MGIEDLYSKVHVHVQANLTSGNGTAVKITLLANTSTVMLIKAKERNGYDGPLSHDYF